MKIHWSSMVSLSGGKRQRRAANLSAGDELSLVYPDASIWSSCRVVSCRKHRRETVYRVSCGPNEYVDCFLGDLLAVRSLGRTVMRKLAELRVGDRLVRVVDSRRLASRQITSVFQDTARTRVYVVSTDCYVPAVLCINGFLKQESDR